LPLGTDGMSILSPQLQGLITLVMMALALTFFYYVIIKTQPKKVEEKTITRTIIRCTTCGYEEKREFTKGDFVGKEVGKCPKDSGPLVISLIYSEKMQVENTKQ